MTGREAKALVRCSECAGTGSNVPDCSLCKGYRDITTKLAYRHRWRKVDLPNLDDDGYCDCPKCYDTASYCMFCYGEGSLDPFIEEQQRMRVLVYALGGSIPLGFYTDHRGEFKRNPEVNLLSKMATRALRDEGMVSWFSSIFGDEIYLTPTGKAEAKLAWVEYRKLCHRWIKAERKRRAQIAAYRAADQSNPAAQGLMP